MKSAILANVIRGNTVESVHRGHIIIVDGDGKEIFQSGNSDFVTFFRSAAKPFQAIPFLLSGAAESFGFSESEIALACASHSGELFHVETAIKMLNKIGLSERDLRCGVHLPLNENATHDLIRRREKPTQLHNNCSGKHSAMLAFAKQTGADVENYETIENPIQQKILKTVAEFCDISQTEIKLAIDGCSAVNFAMPLRNMAKGFSKLVLPPESFNDDLREACRRVVSAFRTYPAFIGGTDRLDTVVMQQAKGKLICKVGAEGLWLCGVLPTPQWKRGLGIALKIEDGEDFRARSVVAVQLLRELKIIGKTDLSEMSPLPLKNHRGMIVGKVESTVNFG